MILLERLKHLKSAGTFLVRSTLASMPFLPPKVKLSLVLNDFPPFSKFNDTFYELLLLYKPKIVVELGTGEGNCTSLIGIALKKNGSGTLYSFDSYGERIQHFTPKTGGSVDRKKQALGIGAVVETIRADIFSHQWTGGPIDMLFIDIDNTFERLDQLKKVWFHHIAPEGIVIFEGGFSRYGNESRNIGTFTRQLREDGWETFTFKQYPGAVIARKITADDATY